jgi:chitinase
MADIPIHNELDNTMNVHTDEAGMVDHEHILSQGFKVFETMKGNDMGQMTWEIPQYERKSDGLKIVGGYWSWQVKDKYGNILIEDIWWNTNEEFDQTMNELK